VFGPPLVQLIDTTILQFLLKESWCFQRGLDEKMNGVGEKGSREDLGPRGRMRRKDESFLRRWGTARARRKKKILFAVP